MDERALRLVAITDDLRDGVDGLRARAERAVNGGATMIQLRLKDADARTLVEVAKALVRALPRVPVIVNDRLDVALVHH
ncbi:MAG TPA: thiamine phosphate synthase, partial [Gemmatimonadaceae bacterium]|nr:thiamine phosphate synthase [Gemmatimonadaceae bacterium]